jgi:hypothetical protein
VEDLLNGAKADLRLYRALRVPVPVIIPPVIQLLSSSSSRIITVSPFYYRVSLRTIGLVLGLIHLKHHFMMVKSNVHSRTGHEGPKRIEI